ncbi:MAG: cupin domain-containing protein, partial [Clostridia bacterium]|nr:cupin domain-containing protein [Clostridia bacterium]
MKNKFSQGMQFAAGSERRDYILSEKAITLEINEMVFYPPYAIDTNHYHNCMEIGICMEGTGTLTMGQKAYAFSSGTIIIVPEGLRHSQQNKGEPCTRWRYIVVDVRRFLTEMPSRCRETITRLMQDIRQSGMYLESGDAHEEVLRLLYTMFDLHSRYAGEAGGEMEALVLMILLRAAREPMDGHMNAVIDPLHMKSIEPS